MASSVNANAVLCVKGEIHNVLTVLRLNSRWASRERFTREIPLQAESPLARAFKGLHSHLEEVDDLANVDTVRYLLPFLAVVESPATTGPMTGVALSSLHKFLLYGFIRKDCPRVKEGITLVAQAISRCHFEETDPESDELVLMKLLELSALCLRCEVGDLLTDESCWNIFLACYNLYHITTDDKSFGLLRDTAGNTLAHIVLMLFSCPRVSRASVTASPSGTPSADATSTDSNNPVLHETLQGQWTTPATAVSQERPPVDPPIPRSPSCGNNAGTPTTGKSSPGMWRQSQSNDKGTETSGGGGGGNVRRASLDQGRGSTLEAGQEEEPWPSVDGANDDGGSRGVDDGVVVAGRGALKAMMGPGNGRFGIGGPLSPVRPAVNGRKGESSGGQEGVLVKVMRFLSLLSDPRTNGSAECILSLSLINIALEAGGADLGRIPALVRVMRGDLCKHLLQNSQTDDLDVLSLTLRVVFNLFNSIKDHLKVQLEVFLTSVHLRVLDGSSYGPEQQELALESLLEFTREPALMTDVYINYDCDVQCTNLFETICHSLSSHALPRDGMEVNALNRLALEGVLAVIESISRRCGPSSSRTPPLPSSKQHHQQHPGGWAQAAGSPPVPASLSGGPSSEGLSASLGGPDSSRRDSVSDSDSDQEYIAAFGGGGVPRGIMGGEGDTTFSEGAGGGSTVWGVGELGWLERARARTAEVLQERKKMKRRLGLAARKFNSGSKGWLEYAQELGLIPTPKTAAATAAFLKGTLLLDKSMLGEYLSRGPADKYPFNAQVLEEYVKLFDMREKTFVEALRAFLKEFRLPGEAQCIDRLMEAFAGQQYEQAKDSGRHPFVNADAAFTMAFSAIMLNTDLHNPQIQDHRRMTLDDFIRNNRQINGGKDLPREFLEDVFDSIKNNEIQVHRDHVAMAADGLGIDYTVHWDGILNRSNNVASASFTPARAARKHLFPAGVHERDMLLSVTGPASDAIRAVFLRTQDDLLVLGCLRGFRSHARACVYLGLLAPFDAALVFFFRRGLEYASAAAAGAAGPPLPEVLKNPGLPEVTDIAACAPFASGCVLHRDLLALKCGLELARAYARCVSSAWGPLLECVFALADLQALPASLTDVDDFGDAQGNPLPPSVFAKRCRDRARSGRNVLLTQSGRFRAAAAAASTGSGGGVAGGGGGLWGSLSGVLFSKGGEGGGGGGGRGSSASEAAVGALAEVVRTVQLEQLFPQTKDLPLDVVEGLLSALLTIRNPAAPRPSPNPSGTQSRDAVSGSNSSSSSSGGAGTPTSSMARTSSNGGGVGSGGGSGAGSGASEAESMAAVAAAAASFEAHAVLALELSSRVVLANRHRVSSLWPALHSFLARVLGGEDSVTMTRMPYLVERAMVTVLRACIHMLDREDMGAMLLQSLRLLLSLPPDVVLPLSNRLASGLLILIQVNASALSLPSTAVQWEVISALMGKAVVGSGGRGFILEALAFVVNRGLGLLGRHNVVAVHALLTRFARGDFADGKADFAWTLQACTAMEAMTFALLQDLQSSPPSTPSTPVTAFPDEGSDTASPGQTATGLVPANTGNVDEVGSGVVSAEGDDGDSAAAPRSPGGVRSSTNVVGVAEEKTATLSRDEAEGMWLSTLQTLGALAGSHFPKVAKGAADALERLVLELHGVRAPAWGTAFHQVLLQLPVPFLPPHFRPTPGVVVQGTWSEEVCLRCSSILSRAFLHHLQTLTTLPGFGKLWLDTVTLLSQNLPDVAGVTAGGAGGVAAESCQQILTNMVMVVAYAGLLGGQHAAGDTGPGDASGGGGSRGDNNNSNNPEHLLHETRQILEPLCPGLRPLLKGLAATSNGSSPRGKASPARPPPPAMTSDAETTDPSSPAAMWEGRGDGLVETTATGAEFQGEETLGRSRDGFVDSGGYLSPAAGGALGGGGFAHHFSSSSGELMAADGLFDDKVSEGESGGGAAGRAETAASAAAAAAAGAREVFDGPAQDNGHPSALSAGRPQIV